MKRVFLILLLLSGAAYGRAKINDIRDRPFIAYFGGDLLFSASKADQENATLYERKFNNSFVLDTGLGVTLWRFLYIGTRFEYWIAGRKFTENGVTRTDKLNRQTVGMEVGYYAGNPRVHWTLSVAAFYPLDVSVTETSPLRVTYSNPNHPLAYQGRLTLGVRLNNTFSLRLEGGYRMENLGNLTSGGFSYLSAGEALDLSGPFLGVNLGLHF